MKSALITQLSYMGLPVRIYTTLDDDYRQPNDNPFFFEVDYYEVDPLDEKTREARTYTDSFCSYETYQAAYEQALEAVDRLIK